MLFFRSNLLKFLSLFQIRILDKRCFKKGGEKGAESSLIQCPRFMHIITSLLVAHQRRHQNEVV